MARVSEKVLAVRERWADDNAPALGMLIRALARAAEFVDAVENRAVVANVVASRLGVAAELVVRTLDGALKVAPDGATRASDRYLMVGRPGASRPDPVQAVWAYAQMTRWGQAPLSGELCGLARSVFRADLYDAALGGTQAPLDNEPRDGIGAFVGPDFVATDIAGYLAAWRTKRPGRPRLSLVR
jgi:NitT/TauT family transport system ATP-binding protein